MGYHKGKNKAKIQHGQLLSHHILTQLAGCLTHMAYIKQEEQLGWEQGNVLESKQQQQQLGQCHLQSGQ